MRLFWFEFGKLGRAYVFWLLCLFCIGANLLYRAGEAQEAASAYGSALWEELLEKTSKLEGEEAASWLEQEQAWRSYLWARLNYGENSLTETLFMELGQRYPEADWEARLKEWEAEPEEEQRDSLWVYAELALRYRYMLSYPAFLRTVEEQAEDMRQIGLFSRGDGFSGKNILRTARVYKRLEGLKLAVDYSPGVEAGTDVLLADGFLLVLVPALSWLTWAREREQGLYPLLQSTGRGKGELAWAKLWAYVCSMAVLGTAMYGSQLFFALSRYGAGSLEIPLQSIPLFRNCPFSVSAGEYLMLFMGIKLLGMFLYGGMSMAVMALQRRLGLSVVVILAVLAGESAAYLWMDAMSPWNPLKFLNLFAVLDARAWFTAYHNINLFSCPVSVTAGKLLLCAGGIPAMVFAAVYAFCHKPAGRAEGRGLKLTGISLGCHASLFFHEGYKLYIISGMALMMALPVCHGLNSSKGISDYRGSVRIQAYRYYIGRLQGEYTEETAAYLAEEEKALCFQDEEALTVQAARDEGSLSEADYREWVTRREAMAASREEAFDEIREQEGYIHRALERWHRGGFVDKYQIAWLFEDDSRQLVFAFLYLAAMVTGISGLTGMEMKYGMDGLASAAVNGRGKLWRRKMEQIFLCGTLLYIMIYLPYYGAVWRDLERVEPGLLLQGVPGYGNFPFAMSVKQAFWLMVGIRYATAMSCCALAAAAVKLTGGGAMGCFAGCALLVLPCALCLWGLPVAPYTCVGGFLPEYAYRGNAPGQYFANWVGLWLAGTAGTGYCIKKNTKNFIEF